MKILHISQTDNGSGAGRAAYRIHQSLLKLGHDSNMLVANKRTDDPKVSGLQRTGLSMARLREWSEARNGRRLSADSKSLFSPAYWSQLDFSKNAKVLSADVIVLYWVNGGFLAPESLALLRKPLVWRLSDVWPLTGGCHYPGECERYSVNCGQCPQLRIPSEWDASRRLWLRKYKAWLSLDLTIAAPSNWMANLARKSSLFGERRIEVVPTGIDLSVYCLHDKSAARQRFNIPQDQLVIAFGALDSIGDSRKGYEQLNAVLLRIAASPLASRVLALIFGRWQLPDESLPITSQFLGRLDHDQDLAEAYSAADIVIVPSLEDNLPNVALEAIACGLPVCGFDVGGMSDIVRNGWNGVLAPRLDNTKLADGIITILSDDSRRKKMAENARKHAEQHFSLDKQAKSYSNLLSELTETGRLSQTLS